MLGMSRWGVNLHNLNGLSRIISVITGRGRRVRAGEKMWTTEVGTVIRERESKMLHC